MIAQDQHTLNDFVTALRLDEIVEAVARAGTFIIPFLIAIYLFELRAGADRARYRTKNFLDDLLYALFYRGGFYRVTVFAMVANLLEQPLGFLRLGLLSDMPFPLALATFWLVGDFVGYWWHRLQHAVPWLWAFHSIHHTQERLTFLTQYRRHPIEALMGDVILLVLFLFILGIPTRQWLPLYAVLVSFEALQHAALNWRFGWLYPVVVSPAFHSIHHSTDPQHYNSNFGKIFSIWDYVFRTAVHRAPRPTRFGVEGLPVPESIPAQLIAPFRMLIWRGRNKSPGSSSS